VRDRLPERVPLLDVRRDVVEYRLPGAHREGAPREPGQPHALGVRRAVGLAEDRLGRNRGALQDQSGERGGADAHGGVALDAQALGGRLDEEQRRLLVEEGAHDEQLRGRAPGDQGLDPVEPVAVSGSGGRGGRCKDVVQDGRLHQRQRRGRDVVAGERRQVGLLLLVGAPQTDRGGDGAGREGRHGEPHVALGECLGDQRAGHRRAFLGDAAE
jgi:hypothetical protein